VTASWFRLRLKHDPAPGFIDHFTFSRSPAPAFQHRAPCQLCRLGIHPSAEGHVNRAIEQAGFATLSDYTAAATPEASGPAPQSVIDISRFMAADGTLNWTPPPGRWRILRMGWSPTGHHNDPAPDEATGLEVDSQPRALRPISTIILAFRSAWARMLGLSKALRPAQRQHRGRPAELDRNAARRICPPPGL
jgi:hypothetical protein